MPVSRAHETDAAADMATAAGRFLETLTPELRQEAVYALTDEERENWHFVPRRRNGVSFKQMNPQQRELMRALLRSGLSAHGMRRAEAIIVLEGVLRELQGSWRDPELYFVTIFGTPANDASWGWRFEGHHISFNFTIVDGRHVFFAPSFLGANPAEVRDGPHKGARALGEEDDLGRALVKSLDDAQRAVAVFAERAPGDIVTGAKRRVEPLAPIGIAHADLSPAQREKLMGLVRLYVGRWRSELAGETLAEIDAAGRERIAFAWAGEFERGEPNYYRIQGPTFLIEFDNTQNGANHIHTTFREFKQDFGRDLLQEHYAQAHPKE